MLDEVVVVVYDLKNALHNMTDNNCYNLI